MLNRQEIAELLLACVFSLQIVLVCTGDCVLANL